MAIVTSKSLFFKNGVKKTFDPFHISTIAIPHSPIDRTDHNINFRTYSACNSADITFSLKNITIPSTRFNDRNNDIYSFESSPAHIFGNFQIKSESDQYVQDYLALYMNTSESPAGGTPQSSYYNTFTAAYYIWVNYISYKGVLVISGNSYPDRRLLSIDEDGHLRYDGQTMVIADIILFAGTVSPAGYFITEDLKYPFSDSQKAQGGDGTLDDTTIDIDDSELPDSDTSAFGTSINPSTGEIQGGFLRQYILTPENLDTVFQKIWSDSGYQKHFDGIVSIVQTLLPISSDGIAQLSICGWTPNDVYNCNLAQYVVWDCGTLDIQEYFGSAMDYNNDIQIYLPFIGYQALSAREVMNSTIDLKYKIDLLNGCCVARLRVHKHDKIGTNSILYQWNGNCFNSLPFSSRDFNSITGARIQMAASLVNLGVSVASSNIPMAALSATSIAQSANSIATAENRIQRGGSIGETYSFLSVNEPYVVITRPNLAIPEDYGSHVGYAANLTGKLGDFTGYTKVSSIHMDGITATDSEKNEIFNLLRGGVII